MLNIPPLWSPALADVALGSYVFMLILTPFIHRFYTQGTLPYFIGSLLLTPVVFLATITLVNGPYFLPGAIIHTIIGMVAAPLTYVIFLGVIVSRLFAIYDRLTGKTTN